MKTKEFIQKVEELGYEVSENKFEIRITVKNGNTTFSVISKTQQDWISLNTQSYTLAKLCVEYMNTPIAEREKVKKYTVQLPNPESYHNFALYKDDYYGVVIMPFNYKNWKKEEIYHLTESEIKRNHSYLWQFAKEVNE